MIVCDFRWALAEQVAKINQNMSFLFMPFFSAREITPLQAGLLFILRYEGPMTIGELSRTASMACGNVSPLIKKLAGQELVEKKRRSSDERIVEISLTAKGAALLTTIEAEMERCFRAVFDEHPQDELAGILEGLNRLNDFLDALRDAAEKAQEEANPLTKKTDKRSS